MKLAIFGGTGLTGKKLVEEAVARGHSVTMLARGEVQPDLPAEVTVIKGDYFDSDARKATIKGADAVLTTIGAPATKKTDLKPEQYGQAMEELIAEMKAEGITRHIGLTSAGTRYKNEKITFGRKFWRAIFNTFFPIVIASKELELKALVASDLEWTSIRPPYIKNDVGGSLKVDDVKAQGNKVDTALLAGFILDQLISDEWVRRAPFIGS